MVIDVHVHVAGTGSHSSCFISEKLRRSPAYLLMLATTGHLFGRVDDETIQEHILLSLRKAELVQRAVFLALDMVYDHQGRPLPQRTHLYVPNDHVVHMVGLEPRGLFGASVHPDRPDALDELERVAQLGAVLVKWIPSSQEINPSRKRYVPFYRKLTELGLPLLCHAGAEHAVPCSEPQEELRAYDDPSKLVFALEQGVKVIAAHCALPVFSRDEDYTEMFIDLMAQAEKEGWALYADISALAAPFPHRVGMIRRILRELPHEKLLLGSDYPIPVSPLWPGAAGEMDLEEWAGAMLTSNPLDRNLKVIRALGFSPQVLTNAQKVLRLP
jgi:predicted TIM-barrel fold metal-dependent hydrolase